LIRPRVIATLGNFATKLLSGKPLGITRVHGVEQEVVLGGNRVTLYPLYHPAAALYTPRMLEVLEADFRRLPGLLGAAVEPPAPVAHVDLYRVRGLGAEEWGDLEPYFDGTIAFVEWPEHAGAWLPPVRAAVTLGHVDESHRRVTIEPTDDLVL